MLSRYLWASMALLAVAVTAANAGKATWYYPANPQNGPDHDSIGSCGTRIANSDMIAALGYKEFGGGANPNNAAICGRKYTVRAPNGKKIVVKIEDKCKACEPGHIDLTPAAFEALGYNRDQGVIKGVTYGP